MSYRTKLLTGITGIAFLACLGSFAAAAQPISEIAFTIPEVDLIPEGIAYDPTSKTFYVSSTYKRKIVSIDSLGTIRDFTRPAQDNLWGVVGMQVDVSRQHLWVATSHAGAGMPMQEMNPEEEGHSGVFKYDLSTGALLKKYVLNGNPDGHFLNDLVVNGQGDVFITDSRADAVYTISQHSDSLEVFFKLERSPNGITLSNDERYLFISLRGEVGRVTVSNRDFLWLGKPDDVKVGADGLYFYQDALIAVEPYNTLGAINRYDLSEGYDAIVNHTVIEREHPAFIQPTTGVVVGKGLYYIANSQLQAFRQMYDERGEAYPKNELQEVVVLKVSID